MIRARVQLVLLWVSQVSRVVADWCLRLTTVLALKATVADSAWHLSTAVFIAPFIVLAPLNGCLSNGLPRRVVMFGAAALTLAAFLVFTAVGGAWLPCLAVVALGAAVYSPARYAVLPAAAADARLPLSRVNAFIEMGGAAAIVAGVWLSLDLCPNWVPAFLTFDAPVVQALLALNLLCLVTSLSARFPSDVLRPEPPARAVTGFFRDCGRILRTPAARVAVLGLAGFQAIVTAGAWPLIKPLVEGGAGRFQDLLTVLTFVGVGAALGCLAAGIQGNPRRNPGLAPFGATGLLVVLLGLMASMDGAGELPRMACLLLGFMGGLVNVPLRAAYMAAVPADARGNGMSVMNTAIYVLTSVLALLMYGFLQMGVVRSPASQLACLAVLSAVGAAALWWLYLPQVVENLLETLIWPMYRVRSHGPGADAIPLNGPLLLLANHSAYLDPFWIFKIVPRQVRPMMTSLFYDLPGISWTMRNLIQAIRVPSATFRREAPELQEAIEVLRGGGCVLVFPEAILRRTDEQLLRLFGRGVWHILQELPETPVMVCWIEGGWGSWTSYFNGPPLKNKRPDWRRRIDIAVDEPRVLPPEVRDDQWRTRQELMERCLECRRYLGLPVPHLEEKPRAEEEAENDGR